VLRCRKPWPPLVPAPGLLKLGSHLEQAPFAAAWRAGYAVCAIAIAGPL